MFCLDSSGRNAQQGRGVSDSLDTRPDHSPIPGEHPESSQVSITWGWFDGEPSPWRGGDGVLSSFPMGMLW